LPIIAFGHHHDRHFSRHFKIFFIFYFLAIIYAYRLNLSLICLEIIAYSQTQASGSHLGFLFFIRFQFIAYSVNFNQDAYNYLSYSQ